MLGCNYDCTLNKQQQQQKLKCYTRFPPISQLESETNDPQFQLYFFTFINIFICKGLLVRSQEDSSSLQKKSQYC